MAITVTMKYSGGTKTSAGRPWRREFIVTATGASALTEVSAATEVETAETLAIGSAHPDDSAAVVTSIDPQVYGDDGRSFTVSVTWETPRFGSSANVDPLLRDPEVDWDFEGVMEALLEDTDGTVIVNSAGERFDPLPERETGELTLRYTRNEASPNFTTIRQYQHAVNDAAFTVDGVVIPERVAKVTIRPGRKTVENGTTYYPVEYHFKFKHDGWRVELLDVGLSEWTSSTGAGVKIRTPILDEQGLEITTPIRLDGLGGALPDASDSEYVGPFKFYHERDFSVFSFT